jgi:hypothetical protein
MKVSYKIIILIFIIAMAVSFWPYYIDHVSSKEFCVNCGAIKDSEYIRRGSQETIIKEEYLPSCLASYSQKLFGNCPQHDWRSYHVRGRSTPNLLFHFLAYIKPLKKIIVRRYSGNGCPTASFQRPHYYFSYKSAADKWFKQVYEEDPQRLKEILISFFQKTKLKNWQDCYDFYRDLMLSEIEGESRQNLYKMLEK